MNTKSIYLWLVLAGLSVSCSSTTTPSTAATTPVATCPFGSTTFTMRDTTRIGCAVVRFTTLGQVNASWAGVDTIPFLGSTTERAWDIVIACPGTAGVYPISNSGTSEAKITIHIGQDEYQAVSAGQGTVTITAASSTLVTGSFSVTATGYATSGMFSFIPS